MKLSELAPFTEAEQNFIARLHECFSRVQPQQPEKGISTLLQRARKQAEHSGKAPERVLDDVYQGAVERTERRIQLLNQCTLKNQERP